MFTMISQLLTELRRTLKTGGEVGEDAVQENIAVTLRPSTPK